MILLDEFEKAHPQLLDLLLQVLGEGRLSDAGGRLADFCNAVVILTSNLGAESFQQGAFGFAGEGVPADRDAASPTSSGEVHRYLKDPNCSTASTASCHRAADSRRGARDRRAAPLKRLEWAT